MTWQLCSSKWTTLASGRERWRQPRRSNQVERMASRSTTTPTSRSNSCRSPGRCHSLILVAPGGWPLAGLPTDAFSRLHGRGLTGRLGTHRVLTANLPREHQPREDDDAVHERELARAQRQDSRSHKYETGRQHVAHPDEKRVDDLFAAELFFIGARQEQHV